MASRVLKLNCRQCSTPVLEYQKSGSGKLIRIYVDRMIGPAPWDRLKGLSKKSDLPSLSCPSCQCALGAPAISEGRLCYRLIPGAVGKSSA